MSADRVQERGSVFSSGPTPLCVRVSVLVFCACALWPSAHPVFKSQTLRSGSEEGAGAGEGEGRGRGRGRNVRCREGEEAAAGSEAICTRVEEREVIGGAFKTVDIVSC